MDLRAGILNACHRDNSLKLKRICEMWTTMNHVLQLVPLDDLFEICAACGSVDCSFYLRELYPIEWNNSHLNLSHHSHLSTAIERDKMYFISTIYERAPGPWREEVPCTENLLGHAALHACLGTVQGVSELFPQLRNQISTLWCFVHMSDKIWNRRGSEIMKHLTTPGAQICEKTDLYFSHLEPAIIFELFIINDLRFDDIPESFVPSIVSKLRPRLRQFPFLTPNVEESTRLVDRIMHQCEKSNDTPQQHHETTQYTAALKSCIGVMEMMDIAKILIRFGADPFQESQVLPSFYSKHPDVVVDVLGWTIKG